MRLKDEWRDAFPSPAAERVIRYMLDTWQKTAARRLEAFSWSQKEPRLTLTFKDQLRDGARDVGLTGWWGSEDQSSRYDAKTLKPLRNFRTDITYHSDREGLSLTFEWKKLKPTSRSRKGYYGEEGMGRFLEPEGYAKDQPFGIMVGIIASPEQRNCIDALVKAMNTTDALGLLHSIPDDHGQHIRQPSRELPGLASFDTQHVRQSGGFSTFTFSHLFVEFPA